MTTEAKLKTARSQLLYFLVNGEEVPGGGKLILGAQKNDIRVQDSSGESKDLRMGLARSDVAMDSLPDFGGSVVSDGTFFSWNISLEDTERGSATLVFYSPDNTEVAEVDCELKPDISFRFVAPVGVFTQVPR